ncbi:MAG: tetratricopeptide repeat protein, partial [Planctomycetes bacterium]|nr:tetratricopeptide repeat protein [Planctomycetota bacterium]
MAAKRLNKNLVIVLTLGVFFMMVVLSVLMIRRLQEGDPQVFVDLAERSRAEGDWRQATIFYHKAWERSGDWDYVVSKGDTVLEGGQVGLALQFWREAIVQQPDLMRAHIRLLETSLELARLQGRVEDWIAVNEAADATLRTETPAEELAFAHHAKGLALTNLESQAPENPERGLVELQEARRLAPEKAEYAIDVALQHVRRDETDAADELFRGLLEKYAAAGADAVRVRLAYAGVQANRARIADATRYFKEALALAEGAPEALLEARLSYAGFLVQQWAEAVLEDSPDPAAKQVFEEAETLLTEATKSNPEAFEPHVQLASLYKAAQRHAEVVEVCERRLKQGFVRKGLEAARTKLNAFRLMLLASEACLELALRAEEAESPEGAKADWLARAQQYINDADAEYPGHPKTFCQNGRIKLAQGKDREALEDLRHAEALYRTRGIIDWENKLRLARLHLSLNEPGAAQAVLEEAEGLVHGRRAIPFKILYAQVLMRTAERGGKISPEDARKIEEVLAAVTLVDPDNPEVKRIKTALLERTGRTHQALMLAESPTVRALLEAREQVQAGNADGAIAVVRSALEKDPANKRLVETLVQELLRLDRTDEARAIVDRAVQEQPEDTYIQKLALITREGMSNDERDRALLDIIEAEEDAYQRCWDLIDFHWRRNNREAALSYFDEAERHLIDRDTPQARNATVAQHRALLKAKLLLAAQLENEDAMAAARDAAVKYDVDGAGGQSIVGLYHLHRQEWDPAIIALTDAVQAQPTNARALTALGQCLYAVGRTDDASAYFERAVRMNPGDGPAHRGLAALAKQRGDLELYEQHLKECEALIPNDPWVRGELLARDEEQNPQDAIAAREEQLARDPDDLANLIRLATLSERVGDLDRADRYYVRLLELRPEDKDLVVAVSKYYRRTDRPERALALVTGFVESAKTEPERAGAMVLVAAHYLNQGDFEQVEATLLAAADLAETLEVVYSLGDFYFRAVNQPREALLWYKRAEEVARVEKSPRLAQVLGKRIATFLHRDIDDVEGARRCVASFQSDFPTDPQGLLWDAEIHARLGELEKAVEVLTRYLVVRPNDPVALFQRAQHYVALGRVATAIDDLEAIRRSAPTTMNFEPRIFLARLHFQAGRKQAWIEELESIVADAPGSATALEQLVAAYIHEKRFAEADRIVTAQMNRAGDQSQAPWYFLRGQVSLELGKPADALRDFSRGAELSDFDAESVSKVLAVYLQTKRFADGVAYCTAHASEANRTAGMWSRYARLLAGADRSREAVEAFREAMNLALRESNQ